MQTDLIRSVKNLISFKLVFKGSTILRLVQRNDSAAHPGKNGFPEGV